MISEYRNAEPVVTGVEDKFYYVIGDGCVMCGACKSICPADAIYAGSNHYEINPDNCIDCGTCANTCPLGIPKPL